MIMNIKSFGSYDLADMARAFPESVECEEANESVFYEDKRYALIVCYGRIHKVPHHDELEVITRYEVIFDKDDTHYPWNFTTVEAAKDFISECYNEENGLL